MAEQLDHKDRIASQIEAWKTIVQVQQHFNDIELKIRGLALTVITTVLGAAALAARYAVTVEFGPIKIKLATLIVAAGIVIWRAFKQVDDVWYHRLLLGSVAAGERIEHDLKRHVPGIELAQTIRHESPYITQRFGHRLSNQLRTKWPRRFIGLESPATPGAIQTEKSISSSDKLRRFYRTVTLLLFIMLVAVQFGNVPTQTTSPTRSPATTTATTPATTSTTAPVPPLTTSTT